MGDAINSVRVTTIEVDQPADVRFRPMATGRGVPSLRNVAVMRPGARRTTMHPLGLYLAITDSQRERGYVAFSEERATFARVDATPSAEPERGSRIGRLTAVLRRHVMRMAGA